MTPEELLIAFCEKDGKLPGGTVHPPNAELKQWICDRISGPPLDWNVVKN